MSIISAEEAKRNKILEDLIKRYPITLNQEKMFLKHSYDSALIIKDVLDRAFYHYPDAFQFRLDRQEIETAAYFHDLGRVIRKNQLFHELRGADFLEKEGVRLGIVSSERQAKVLYRVAETIRSHFVVYEQFNMPELESERSDFKEIDPYLLVPVTWNQKFVVYAELSNVRGERMNPKERIEELKNRYSNDKKYKDKDPFFLRAIELGEKRILHECYTVEKLISGKMDEREISRYGFLM